MSVTKKLIYQLCLALPILLPLVLLPAFWNMQSMGSYVGLVMMVILYSGMVGGLPYLMLMIPLLIWSRKKTDVQMRKALLLSPVLLLIPLAICYAVFQFGFEPGKTLADTTIAFVTFYLFFAACTLAFGYLYVAITLAIASLFSSNAEGS